MNPNFPWFRRTSHGIRVLAAGEYVPNDPTGYLARLANRVPALDPTVLVYLSESLETYRKGNSLASVVMLGIAAERVFLLIGESLHAAISDPSEKKKLEGVLALQAIKPKLDWIERKIRAIEDMKPRLRDFPENAHLATMSLYDLLRKQRNELGHPREDPPTVDRHSAFTNLLLFPELYETAERVRRALAAQQA